MRSFSHGGRRESVYAGGVTGSARGRGKGQFLGTLEISSANRSGTLAEDLENRAKGKRAKPWRPACHSFFGNSGGALGV
jgi:hypothetical protein